MTESKMTFKQVISNALFTESFLVRDYECDMQGIVNNAVYQNYFEHTRHQFLKSKSLDFAEITESGINLVVYRAEIDYKSPLKSGDEFDVLLNMEVISKIRVVFRQEIVRKGERKPCVLASFFVTGITKSGRPNIPDYILKIV